MLESPSAFLAAVLTRVYFLFPDKFYLQLIYRLRMGEKLHLDNSRKFTEKIQWLKLYNRKPEYTMMVDKYAVKDYVENIIGKEHIIPTLGVWDRVEDIDWNSLPNRFVLKTTHGGGGGGVFICKDKTSLNVRAVSSKLRKAMKSNIAGGYGEKPYEKVPKRIIAEEFMEDPNQDDLVDYKFFCFNGVPTYCQVIANRRTKETIDFFDMEWNHQEFCGFNPKCSNAERPEPKLAKLAQMVKISENLSKDIPFLRVDLYYINGNVYFGELTFFPASGYGVFTPEGWNEKLGSMLSLN